MTEEQIVKLPSNVTAEGAALALFQAIIQTEGKHFGDGGQVWNPDRKWILDTFAECLITVREPERR